MLERYLTPIFFSYVDKYVKNLTPSDLRLSLWQGEVALDNLELRLDVLESDLGLPVQLVSGKIRRLHIQVPWTALSSEPVRVTVDTLECVLKWKDDDSDSRSYGSASSSSQASVPPPAPGYIQSWTNRIVNNVDITVNNIVLKYVEEDIVLSVNIQELHLFTVDSDWKAAFVDASQPHDTLRKGCQITDMTICLDKRDSSGRIPFYQEPLVYKTSLTVRILYDVNRNRAGGLSACPGTTYDIFWEHLDISVSSSQLPMFVRIVNRVIAIYYGCNLDGGAMPVCLPVLAGCDSGHGSQTSAQGMPVNAAEQGGAGWVSWAWSVVAGGKQDDGTTRQNSFFLTYGLYVHMASFTYKLMESASPSSLVIQQKFTFKPVLQLQIEDFALKTVMQGIQFYDFSIGVTNIKGIHLTSYSPLNQMASISQKGTQTSSNEIVWLQCGTRDECPTNSSYLNASLFGDMQRGSSVDFVASPYEPHDIEACSSQFAAVWFQYRNTLCSGAHKSESGDGDTAFESWLLDTEREATRQVAIIGDTQVVLTRPVKVLIDDLILSGSKWNEHLEKEGVTVEPPEEMQQALKRYSAANYDLDLMRQIGIPMKTVEITCKGFDIVLACGASERQLQDYLPSNRSQTPQILLHELSVYLYISEIRYSLSQPIYPDQLRVDGVEPYKHLVSMPDSLSSLMTLEASHVKVAFSPIYQQQELESLDCSLSLLSCPQLHIRMRQSLLPLDWHQAGQLFSQQVVNIPTLALEASGPQLICAYDCYSTVVSGSDEMISSSSQARGRESCLHLEVSSLKLESSSWSDAVSYSCSVRNVVLYISTTDEVEARASYVPLVCGPLVTDRIYDGALLKEKLGCDCLKSSMNLEEQDPVLFFRAHIPIYADKSVASRQTAVPLFIVTIRGMAFNLDPLLHSWIGSLVSRNPGKDEVNQENGVTGAPSINTARSVEGSWCQHSPRQRSNGEADSGMHKSHVHSFQKWWSLLAKMNTNITVHPLVVFMPTANCPGLQSLGDLYSYDVLAYYCALVTQSSGWPSLSPTLVASLPSITVSSSQFKDEYKDPLVLSSVLQSDKPVPSCTLPWSVTCEKFSIYTLHPLERSADTAARTVLGSKLLYLVEPLSLDIVIAPSSGLGKTSELSGGGYMMSFGREVTVCCHMSVGTVLLAISRKQIQVMKCIAQIVASSAALVTMMTTRSSPVDSGAHSLPSMGSRRAFSQSPQHTFHRATSEVRTFVSTDISSSHYTEASIARRMKESAYSLWVQLTIPKLSMSVYHRLERSIAQKKEEIICVCAELEDTSASADFSDVCVSGKLNIGFIAVKHSKMEQAGSQNKWIDGLYSGLLLASSKVSIFPQGQKAPILPQSRSSVSLGFRSFPGTAGKKAHTLELKFALLPFTVVPWLPALNAIMDSFDLSSKQQDAGRADDSFSSSLTPPSRQTMQKQDTYYEIPQLHIDIDDIVVLLPVNGKVVNADTDKVVLFQVSSLSLMPRPQNPISRPLSAEHEVVYLKLDGFSCDEKQLQLNIGNIEMWTAEWNDVAPNLVTVGREMLSSSALSGGEQNPALEWNLAGRSKIGQSTRVVPVLRNVTVQSVIAPAISSIVKMEDRPCKLTFGHSLEVNLLSDIKITLNDKQIVLFVHLLDQLLSSNRIGSSYDSDAALSSSAVSALPCEILVTASKISCAVYSVVGESALPLLHVSIIQPSLRLSTSPSALEMKLNCYNCGIYTGQSGYYTNHEDPSALDHPNCFPRVVVTTQPGKRNSSGILPSLLYLMVSKTQDDSAVIECKLARPLIIDVGFDLLVRVTEFMHSLEYLSKMSSTRSAQYDSSPTAQPHTIRTAHPTVIVSTIQVKLSLSVDVSAVCASFQSFTASFYGGNNNDSRRAGTASVQCLSIKLKHKCESVYLLLPVDIAVNTDVTDVEQSGLSSMTTTFMKVNLSPVAVKLETLHYQYLDAIMNNTAVDQLVSLLSQKSHKSDHHDASSIGQQDGIRWESEDDIRSGALEYVIQMAEVDRRPEAGQIVFLSGVEGRYPAMSWCYAEPRALSAIQALPLPMSSASEVSLDLQDEELHCLLRYYDVAKRSYVDVLDFYVSQTDIIDVELPENVVAAHEWQVVVSNYSNGAAIDATVEDVRHLFVSPMALAGCLKINSYFSTSLVPSVNIILDVGRVEIKLMNYITQLKPLKTEDAVFQFDDALPWEHEVACVRLDDMQLHGKFWLGSLRQNAVIQIDTRMQIDYIDFGCLQWQSFLSPFDVHIHYAWKPISPSSVSSTTQSSVGSNLAVSVESMAINLAQSLVHTTGRLLVAWQCCGSSSVAMSQYFICNNTTELLEFGETTSAQLIAVKSGYCRAYFWSSESSRHLRVRIAGSKVGHWSELFMVEKKSTFAVEIPGNNNRSVMLTAAVSLDGAIRTVVFTGTLQFVNSLKCGIVLRIQSDRHNSQEREIKLQGQTKSLSVIETKTVNVAVRQDLGESTDAEWSTPVQIQLPASSLVSGTITLPVRINTNQVVGHYIAFSIIPPVNEKTSANHTHQFVLLPIFRIQNFFPDPVIVHLAEAKANSRHQMKYVVRGRNQTFDVPFVDANRSYDLSLQLSAATPPSVETLCINVSVDKHKCQQVSHYDIDRLMGLSDEWPFLSSLTTQKKLMYMTTPAVPLPTFVEYGIPNKPLLASVAARVSKLAVCPWTTVISLEPPAIITNCTQHTFVMHHCGFNQAQKVVPDETIALFCKIPFRLGLVEQVDGNEVYQWSETIDTLLPSRPVGRIVKPIVILSGRKVCHLVMNESFHEDMLVLSVSDAVQICNMSNIPLTVAAVIGHPEDVQSDLIAGKFLYETQQLASGSSSFESLQFSFMCSPVLSDENKESQMTQIRRLPCLSFSSSVNGCLSDEKQSWSLPVFLRHPALRRVAVSVFYRSDNRLVSLALSFRTDDMGLVYVTVSNDLHPRLIVNNYCSMAIKVAESLPQRYIKAFPSAAVVEDIVDQQLAKLHISPGASTVYECPTWATAYLRKATVEHNTHLRFLFASADTGSFGQIWSKAVSLGTSVETVTVCDTQNISIRVVKTGTCWHVTVLNKEEQNCSHHQLQQLVRAKTETSTPLHISTLVESIWVRVIDELSDEGDNSSHKQCDVVAFSVDLLRASFTSDVTKPGYSVYKAEISIQSCQLDNLLKERHFDFSVVLYQQRQQITSGEHNKDSPLLTLCTCLNAVSGGISMQSVKFTLQPVVVLLEDTLLYILMETAQSLYKAALTSMSVHHLPSLDSVGQTSQSRMLLQPCDVVSVPLVVDELDVSPLSVFLSLRASLRLFLSSDHTPLSFENLLMKSVFTQSSVFRDALLNHYGGGMLSKAGWLIGSLELLGSPASLLLNTGAAFRDLVYFPYEGLTRGPRSFVTGLGHGAASCVRHLSSGALSSVTGLASSISRNVERLSLDQRHIRMQEEQRTRPPQHLSTGLMQGFAALGLGVLGALAGLVDQPLQSLENIDVSSPSQAAKDVAVGVGRGLVGAVAKPVAGAMELVSQAGQGLLNSAGLSEAPKKRNAPVLVPGLSARTQRYLQTDGETLLSVHCLFEGSHKESGNFHCAVLTRNTLCLYKGINELPKVYPLIDITLIEDTSHSQVVCVLRRQAVADGSWETEETLPVTTKVERFLYSSSEQDECDKQTSLISQSLCMFTVPDKADRHLLLTCVHALQDQS